MNRIFLAIALLIGTYGECASELGTMATWVDSVTTLPYYSIYNGTSWSTAAAITTSVTSNGNVFTAYDSSSGATMATWTNNDGHGYYAIYQNGTWGSAAQITGVSSPKADVSVAFDSYSGKFAACWANGSSRANIILYSNGSWGSLKVFSAIFLAHHNVYVAFDTSGNGIATWTNSGTNEAVYSLYYGGEWNLLGQITTPSGVTGLDVYISYNSSVGFVATWSANDQVALMGATTTISDMGAIDWMVDNFDNFGSTHQVAGDMGSSYNPILNETIVAIEENDTSGVVYYATNSSGTWSTASSTGLATSNSVSVYTTFDANTQTTLAAFPDTSLPGTPFYATYNGTSWTQGTISDTSLANNWIFVGPAEIVSKMTATGARKVNNFGTLREYYDALSWTALAGANSYLVIAGGVAVGSTTGLTYTVHNLNKNGSNTYTVEALDASGNVLSSVTVTVN